MNRNIGRYSLLIFGAAALSALLNSGRASAVTSPVGLASREAVAPGAAPAEVEATPELFASFADFLNEVSARRRRVVYLPNPQSIFDGAPLGFVNTATGNLTFRRRDMLLAGLLPIEVTRVYDSRRLEAGDFGPGWALTVAETLHRLPDGDLEYANAAGVRARLRAARAGYEFVKPAPTDVLSIARSATGAVELLYRTGLRKTFVRAGTTYRLASKRDRFGNGMALEYAGGMLTAVVGLNRERRVDIRRDGHGRVAAVYDETGRRVSYRYDHRSRLVAVEDLGGAVWNYEYDAADRLVAAVAPSGHIDIAIAYAASGRVDEVIRHGVGTRYNYAPPAEDATGGVTRVERDGAVAAVRTGHAADGRLGWLENGVGPRQTLRYDHRNRVVRLDAGAAALAEFEYDESNRLARLWRAPGADRDALAFVYATDHLLTGVSDASGAPLVRIERDAAGLRTSVATPGRKWALRRGPTGALAALVLAGDRHEFDTDADGQITAIRGSAGELLSLDYDAVGRLLEVGYPDGLAQSFEYGSTGFRTATRRANGDLERYRYTPTGNLRRYELHRGGELIGAQNYELDDDHRLSALLAGGALYRFAYDSAGELTRVTWAGASLGFGYDALRRFDSVILDDGSTLRYAYSDDEPDVRRQRDAATPVIHSGLTDLDPLNALAPAALRGRATASPWQVIALDPQTMQFESPAFGVALPGDAALTALQRMRVLDSSRSGIDLLQASDDARADFGAPSNSFFIPPEFWATNCRVCPPEMPLSPPGAGAAGAAAARFVAVAAGLERCPGGGFAPAPDNCALSITGLPSTLCLADNETATASISPPGLDLQSVSWFVNGTLSIVPSPPNGPSVSVHGTAAGSGRIWAKFLDDGLSCTSPQVAVSVADSEPASFQALASTVQCPQRSQDTDELHDIDGCSLPQFAVWLFGGSQQDPVAGQYHAPGQGTAFGEPEGSLPGGGAPLPLPCNRHDMCYQTCGAVQDVCDVRMLMDMGAVCDAAYPANCPHGSTTDCAHFEVEKDRCTQVKNLIFSGLALGARTHYQERQVDYCKCCGD